MNAARSRAGGPTGDGPDPLARYRARRDFARTAEPDARVDSGVGGRFVVQRHAARRLHFDLRLELDGVLKSWAITRGPSIVSGDRRLAVRTEDHPVDYLDFEGVIPAGEYGGGTMIVWDRGTWAPQDDPRAGLAKGHLSFTLHGERLGGGWHLVRMKPRPREKAEQWLLLKSDDSMARPPTAPAVTEVFRTSVVSGRTNAELAASGSLRVDHASRAAVKSNRAATAAAGPVRRGVEPRKALLPVFVAPSLATLADAAPVG
jgi:bifunctional non-homologous end joining protein LigD